jgi:hypothetical protein
MKKTEFTDSFELPINEININKDEFQNREKDFSQETYNRIIDEGYNKKRDPIVVWRNPEDDKFYILSGHSRFAAANYLHDSGKQDLSTLPVIELKGTKDEAIEYATIRSNREQSKETLKEDISAYQNAIKLGYNRQMLLKYFNPESYLQKLKDFSFLNPKGRFMEYIDTDQENSFPYLRRNAQWIGVLRRNYPNLSNAHETEIFNFIYTSNSGALQMEKKKLEGLIEKRAGNMYFNPDEPLHLDRASKVSNEAAKNPVIELIKEVNARIDERANEIRKKQELIARARAEGGESIKLIPKFTEKISELNLAIVRDVEELHKLEASIHKVEANTFYDIFNQPTEGEQAAPAPEDKETRLKLIKLKAKAANLLLTLNN